MMCPVCKDSDCVESATHDNCTACGWAQFTPIDPSRFQPSSEKKECDAHWNGPRRCTCPPPNKFDEAIEPGKVFEKEKSYGCLEAERSLCHCHAKGNDVKGCCDYKPAASEKCEGTHGVMCTCMINRKLPDPATRSLSPEIEAKIEEIVKVYKVAAMAASDVSLDLGYTFRNRLCELVSLARRSDR